MKGIPFAPEVRELVIKRVKEGEKVNDLAREFKCYPNTIRKWLAQDGVSGTDESGRNHRSLALLVSKHEREKQDLINIIGEMAVQIKELSKKKSRSSSNS
jgi:uncharacterized protein YjcR